MKLEKGYYNIDISCKNGKSHIFNNEGKEVFEGELIEVHEVLFLHNRSKQVENCIFKYVVY